MPVFNLFVSVLYCIPQYYRVTYYPLCWLFNSVLSLI